jgi:excisionase family DNA binding protein
MTMATTFADGARLLVDARDAEAARSVLLTLDDPSGYLSVGRDDVTPEPLPRETGLLLQDILRAVATGGSVNVVTIPHEVTTSTAAAMLGVSRPTLMKLVQEGSIPAHKVGTHTRLRADDVLAAKKARRKRERAAFEALLAAEDE